jgi:integrase
MARIIERLTALQVSRARQGKHHDGGGLYLIIHKGGSRSWAFRYGPQGRRYLGLGPTHTITLAAARERARACREMLLDGRDPIVERQERKAAGAKVVTFAEAVERYVASNRAAWGAEHAKDWNGSVATYVLPVLGAVPVHAVDTALVLKVLEPVWQVKTVTATRVRGRIESILDWAKARGYRTGENPARWDGHLDQILPAPTKVATVKHHAALPYADVGAFMSKLRARAGVAARTLEFVVLTAARLGEALGAEWDEVDLRTGTWTIPGNRMKGGREHRVPLSPAAAALLKQMAAIRTSDFVFPGARRGRAVGESSVLTLAKDVANDKAVTVHGFRSTFRKWAAEQTNFAPEICEQALAHNVGTEVERVYTRTDLFDKRRRLMDAWAGFCAKPAAKAGNVRALRAQ